MVGERIIPKYRDTWGARALVFGGCILLALLLRAKALPVISSHFIGGFHGDAGIYLWIVRAFPALLSPSSWFEIAPFYPYTQALAFSDCFLLPAAIVRLLMLLGAGLPLAWNLFFLGVTALNGYCSYRLLFQLTGARVPAVFAAAAVMSLSPVTVQLGHPQLQFLLFFPLLLSSLFSFLDEQKLRHAVGIGVLLTLTLLSSAYFFVFALLLTALILATFYCIRPYAVSPPAWFTLLLGISIGASPSLAIIAPYLDVKAVFGSRQLYEAFRFAADGAAYLSAARGSLLYGRSRLAALTGDNPENWLFPGFIILLLAAAALRHLRPNRAMRIAGSCMLVLLAVCAAFSSNVFALPAFYQRAIAGVAGWCLAAALLIFLIRYGMASRADRTLRVTSSDLLVLFSVPAIVFFLLSLGPLGDAAKQEPLTGFHLAFYHLFPGVDGVRAVQRYAIPALFCLTVIAALGIPRGKDLPIFSAAVAPFALFLAVAENIHGEIALEPPAPPPLAVEYLARLSKSSGALLFMPYAPSLDKNKNIASWGAFARANVDAMHWAFESGRRLINGYSGIQTKTMRDLPRELAGFPDVRSHRALKAFAGLQYIIVSARNDPDYDAAAMKSALQQFQDRFETIAEGEDGSFLVELAGQVELDPSFELLVPAHPAGSLALELRCSGEPLGVEVLLKSGAESRRLADLVADCGVQEPQSLLLPLNEPLDRVRPLRLAFRSHDGRPLQLRRSTFLPGP